MTQPTLLVFCDVRRIGPKYDATSAHFSLNLTVAFQDAASKDLVRKYVLPWLWNWDGALRCWDVDTMQVVSVKLLPKPTGNLASLVAAFQQRLEDHQPQEHPERFVWSPDTAGRSQRPLGESWMGFVAHQSTLPAPLPQILGLTVTFKVADANLPAGLLAAPIFAVTSIFGAKEPGAPRLSTVPHASGLWESEFTPTDDGVVVKTLQRACETKPAAKAGRFDLGSLWVLPPIGGSAPMSNWVVALEQGLPRWCDLPDWFLRYLDANPTAPLPRNFVAGFVGTLQDSIGYGFCKGPARTSPASAVLSEAAILALGDAFRKLDGPSWKRALEQTLSAHLKRSFTVPVQAEGAAAAVRPALGELYKLATDDAFLRARLAPFLWALADTDRPELERLARAPLRALHLAGNAGIAWQALSARIASGADAATLAKAVAEQIVRYLDARMAGGDTTGGYESYVPKIDSVPAQDHAYSALRDWIRTQAEGEVKAALEHARAGRTIRGRTTRDVASGPDGIVLQIDDLGTHWDDAREALAGVGLLLRRDGSSDPWCCLHLARLGFPKPHTAAAAADDFPLAIVPHRLALRNGVPELFLEYQAQPLSARSPASELFRKRELGPVEDTYTGRGPLLRYDSPYAATGGAPRLPPLGFGWDYQAAIFSVANGGPLPVGVAAGGDAPWVLAAMPTPDAGAIWKNIPLRRRVPVGAVRIVDVDKEHRATRELDRVYPIARALHLLESPKAHESRPLYLLVPEGAPYRTELARPSIDLELYSPATDIHTWDRWLLRKGSPEDLQQVKLRRKAVWAEYHRINDIPEGEDKAANKGVHTDAAALDDPAVSGLAVSMRRIFSVVPPPGGPSQFDASHQFQRVASAYGTIAYEQRGALVLHIVIATGGKDDLVWKDGRFEASVNPGAVYELTITAAVDGADTCFAAGSTPAVSTIYVEVPMAFDKDAARALRDKLCMGASSIADGDVLSVSLALPPSLNGAFALVHRAEVMLQRWRWDGRPVAHYRKHGTTLERHDGFPVDLLGDSDEAAAALCDATLFGSRSADDVEIAPTACDPLALADRPSRLALHGHPLGKEHGAMYFRTGVRFVSRYEGLLALDASVDTRGSNRDAWLRTLVPASRAEHVPPPAVRMIVPLTGNWRDDDGAAASLLVVVDEEWFAETGRRGGIAESLEYEIVSVGLPDRTGARAQLGKDPLLDTTSVPEGRWRIDPQPLVGPVGYTLDESADAPLFARASFVLRPPTVTDATTGAVDLARFFIQVRFRRSFEEHLCPGRLPSEQLSPWTGTFWGQFLAANNRLRVETGEDVVLADTGELSMRRSMSGKLELVRNVDGASVIPRPTTSDGSENSGPFHLYALVTRTVVDAFGRDSQEVFVDLLRFDRAEIDHPYDASFHVRVVEVLRRRDAIARADDDPWDGLAAQLFPANGEEPSAQIVRVSPPIGTSP